MIVIREEHAQDTKAIREVNVRAFGQSTEADIVDKLRKNCNDLLSLVAVINDRIVGHILFSEARIECENRTVQGMALAPMAVLPEHQRQGIGSELIKVGIDKLSNSNCPFVIVLGHPEYYPRFGFEPASRHGIRCEWEVSDDTFMVLIIDKSEMKGISGVAKYRPEFVE
ncbi:MAG: GNAT family N-acetyltransferase [Candidatus Latescibacteria bacterium]|nr:GNAT family N-acetyltransferase [Candidatus Latescibacterota bacterium]NIO27106.1 GNAT family N-acetyltransferase [Candidatus Latescibacterota bacterium]NIO54630.1 GNAT family N-acetyltransferase [Candidatus Latescibacterota bacterium]NIT00713.1 GNAT family N-acetyltransferase [Candidatus Latescibacterota bacterium]NIT37636.1 GNAT family N-acetyltransferase [Candidatus Latescibacterota bacterium]